MTEPVYWCNAHNRIATHKDRHGQPRCDPRLGGIMLPCAAVGVVEITDILEIEEQAK